MTKKDFELIAETIRFADVSTGVRQHMASEFADSLRKTNHHFDRERFMNACLLPTKVDQAAVRICEYCDAGDPTSVIPYHPSESCPSNPANK